MADDGDNSTMTEAERRRVRRRQKILDNQGARMNRILGSSASSKCSISGERKATKSDDDEPAEESKVPLSSPSLLYTKKGSGRAESSSVHSSNEPTNLPQILKELSEDFTFQSPSSTSSPREEIRLGVQSDGTVILPKISQTYGRIILCVLAIFLSLLNARQFAVTFISWEIAYYFLNGLPPCPPANTFLVAMALVGMKESHLQIFKKIMHMLDCASVDFALFLSCVMMPHIVSTIATIIF